MALTPEDVVNKRFQPTKFREGYDQDEVDDFLDEIVIELRRLYQENDELRKKVAELEANPKAAGSAATVAAPAPVSAEKPAATETASTDARPASANAAKPAKDATESKAAAPAESSAPAAPATLAANASAPATSSVSVSPSAESAAGVLAMAQKLHDDHVNSGIEQRDKIIAEAQIEASSLVNDAQEKSKKTLSALEQQRSVLERKVEQLRGFERDYRARLKAYIEGQLRDLDAKGSVAAPDLTDGSSSN